MEPNNSASTPCTNRAGLTASCAQTVATTEGCQLTTHKLQQCYRCNRQTSITAGTIFEATKLPLTVWFQGIYFMTQDKKGCSAMKLHRQLGISYNAAWRMRHKLSR